MSFQRYDRTDGRRALAPGLAAASLLLVALSSCSDEGSSSSGAGASAATGGAGAGATGGEASTTGGGGSGAGAGGGEGAHELDCADGVDNDGDRSTDCEDSDCTGALACATPGDPLFFDDFEYAAGREDPNVVSVFQTEGGWTGAKTVQGGANGARGYVHTVDAIPGSNEPFPGLGSQTVLCLEALPTSLGDHESDFWGDWQTDFYLQYGSGDGPADAIPADVWFQFWVYPTGGYDHGMKFLYPCNGDYPCQDLNWLFGTGTTSGDPHYQEVLPDGSISTLELDPPPNELPAPHLFIKPSGTGASYQPPVQHAYHGNDMGQTDVSELLAANRWTLVKLHFDTSGGQGTYEAWLRPREGDWVKVAEWIGSTTPSFTWPVARPGGHRVLRMPTTIGSVRTMLGYPDHSYDSWTYMDDFTMATAEVDLPVYP